MASAFHDTLFAYTLRSVFGSRVFAHPDEKVLPTIWQDKLASQTSPRDSAQSTVHDVPRHDVSSIHSGTTAGGADAPRKVDPEKGNDTLLVDWYGPTDPDVSYLCVVVPTVAYHARRFFQNPLNWSSGKKAWVMFQTCLLTFTIYVGSAIYTAGIPSISAEFHVSTVAATVGLTVFVAGYGLGK